MVENSSLKFRDDAQQLADPSSLQAPVAIVEIKTRVFIYALTFLVTAIVIWSAWAKVPIKVAGTGVIVIKGQQLSLSVTSSHSGQVQSVLVGRGQPVTAGMVVAKLSQPDLQAQLQLARSNLRESENKYSQIMLSMKADLRTNQQARQQKTASNQQQITDIKSRLPYLKEKERELKAMLASGLVSKDEQARAALARQTAANNLSELQAQQQQILAQTADQSSELEQQQITLSTAVKAAKNNLKISESALHDNIDVIAKSSGTVVEMNIIRGDWVSTGQRVVVLSPVTQAHKQQQLPLSALVYVPLNKGKQLSVGMPVLLEVSSVIKGGFGKVKATVVSVSDLAVSSDTLSLRLNNPELEKQILAAGAPFELLVDLEPDATEVSGYRWTSTPGPKVHLSPGTYVDASVTEQSRTIMSLVIPALRQLFQLDES